jgi:hypothetical protein
MTIETKYGPMDEKDLIRREINGVVEFFLLKDVGKNPFGNVELVHRSSVATLTGTEAQATAQIG